MSRNETSHKFEAANIREISPNVEMTIKQNHGIYTAQHVSLLKYFQLRQVLPLKNSNYLKLQGYCLTG